MLLQPNADPARITEYHAHVYYRPETKDEAAALREGLGARFPVRLGRWHDALVGPHTASMYQVAFAPEAFAQVVPWLMLNHGTLDVLLHPETGDELTNHTVHAAWLGQRLPLRLEALAPGADDGWD